MEIKKFVQRIESIGYNLVGFRLREAIEERI